MAPLGLEPDCGLWLTTWLIPGVQTTRFSLFSSLHLKWHLSLSNHKIWSRTRHKSCSSPASGLGPHKNVNQSILHLLASQHSERLLHSAFGNRCLPSNFNAHSPGCCNGICSTTGVHFLKFHREFKVISTCHLMSAGTRELPGSLS